MLSLSFFRFVAVLVAVLVYPLSKMLPEWVAWENQAIENLQVVVLFLGMIAACIFQYRSGGQWKWFWLSCAPIWFLIIARELSWGAVFYPPTRMTELGPFFSSRELWYKPFVYPSVALIIAATCCIVIYHQTWQKIIELIRGKGVPWFSGGLVVFFLVISASAEGHIGPISDLIGHSMLLEELAELAAYCWLLAAQLHVRQFQLR